VESARHAAEAARTAESLVVKRAQDYEAPSQLASTEYGSIPDSPARTPALDRHTSSATAEHLTGAMQCAQTLASELTALLDDPEVVHASADSAEQQLRQGIAANQQDDFATAAAWFEEAHRRRPRVSTLLSVANMRLKLGDGPLAACLYVAILEHPASTEAEREMADRKLHLAEFQLQQLGAEGLSSQASIESVGACSVAQRRSSSGQVDAPDWLVSAEGTLQAQIPVAAACAPPAPSMPYVASSTVRAESEAAPRVMAAGRGDVGADTDALSLRQREVELRCSVEMLKAKLDRQQREAEDLLSSTRRKDESLEAMLREVTQVMKAEICRSAQLQEAHEVEAGALKATVVRLEQELNTARRNCTSSAGGAFSVVSYEPGGIGDRISAQLVRLPSALSHELGVKDALLKHGSDSVRAAPDLLLPAFEKLLTLHEQNVQLTAASEAVMAAQADAVKKLAASAAASCGTGVSAAGVVGSAVSYWRGGRKPENGTTTSHASELSRKDAEIARLREQLAGGAAELRSTRSDVRIAGSLPALHVGEALGEEEPAEEGSKGQPGLADQSESGAPSDAGLGEEVAAGTNASAPMAAPPATLPTAPTQSTVTPPPRPASSRSSQAPANTASAEASAPSAATALAAMQGTPGSLNTPTRNAKAVKYVDTLLGRANRDKIPEEDARQALEYFEAAKASNAAEDYKAACSYFETSFLLNPKLTTLISTANMCGCLHICVPRALDSPCGPVRRHLKLRNPMVAAEIYTRLLQNPSVPQREREVALRKLAMCKTMLGTPPNGVESLSPMPPTPG